MLILVQAGLIQRAHEGESHAIPFSSGFKLIILSHYSEIRACM